MMMDEEQCLHLISQVWAGNFPLVKRYFGKYLGRLVKALQSGSLPEGRFVRVAFSPERLERRLQIIEPLGQTSAIVSEIGDVRDPIELDTRLVNAWAELRTLYQLHKEGFEGIQKIRDIADLTATKQGVSYAFQVTRITTLLKEQFGRRNPQDKRNTSPYGPLDDVYERFDKPLSYFFWNALERKNNKFKKWDQKDWIRCIVIVSSDDALQDALVRHIACQRIRDSIELLNDLYFEELLLLWLPDLGNGAWFKIDVRSNNICCFVDWGDAPESGEDEKVNRIEVDLDSMIPLV